MNFVRVAAASRASLRAFSTSSARRSDLCKLVLIGNLGRDPEQKQTKNNTDYVTYTIATTSFAPPAMEGERPTPKTTWHRVFAFQESSKQYLLGLKKGSKVYVEANFELREPDADADPTTPQGQRQIFLRHNSIVLLNPPRNAAGSELESEDSHA